MTAAEPLAQCESCHGMFPESELTPADYPGATLAFCDECIDPPRAAQYGVGAY